jgi:hypothetical protein
MQFKAWPVDEGEMGIRLDVDVDREADLPPCPGLGGWKKAGSGIWWTRIKGQAAMDLAAVLSGSPDGWFQDVMVTMDGDRLAGIVPA